MVISGFPDLGLGLLRVETLFSESGTFVPC